MNRRLIFFIGVYDTLDIFAFELQREFEGMGYETMLFDTADLQKSLGQLAAFVKKPVTAVITFNNLGYNMELTQGNNIWNDLDLFVVNILMDHPFCYKPALDASPRKAAVLCPDRNHMRYIQRFYPQIPISGYLPHAGIARGGAARKIAERRIDVLYAGGLSRDYVKNVMPDFQKYKEFDAEKIADQAYHMLIECPHMTTEEAVEKTLCEAGIQVSEDRLCEIIADLHYVDLLAASYYREKTVRTLVEHGIHVHLYGNGWEACTWLDHPNLVYGGRVSAEEIIGYMQESKIVLNTMTWFKDGTHDRVFNGMLAGAVAVTDSSVYMKEEFPDTDRVQQKLVMFELTQIDQLPDLVRELLYDTDQMQQIADRGYVYAKEHHTWKCRAKELQQDLLDYL